jgi:hypothetical protein
MGYTVLKVHGMPAPTAKKPLLLNFRNGDTRFTVARATLKRLAEHLGLNETQVVHLALKDLAARELPRYAPDDGLPSKSQIRSIQKAAAPYDAVSVGII